HAPVCSFHGCAHYGFLLVRLERGIFAEGPQHHEAIAACIETGFEAYLGCWQVQRAVLFHFGHQCGHAAVPAGLHVGYSLRKRIKGQCSPRYAWTMEVSERSFSASPRIRMWPPSST